MKTSEYRKTKIRFGISIIFIPRDISLCTTISIAQYAHRVPMSYLNKTTVEYHVKTVTGNPDKTLLKVRENTLKIPCKSHAKAVQKPFKKT